MTIASSRLSPNGLACLPAAPACLGILLALATPVDAATFHDDWRTAAPHCYTRHYDAKHLAAHPHQRLTSFMVRSAEQDSSPEPGTFEVFFAFTVKGSTDVFEGVGICGNSFSSTVNCGIEGDGGDFLMRVDGAGLLITVGSAMQVEGSMDFSPDLAVGGDDQVVRLYPGPSRSCRFG